MKMIEEKFEKHRTRLMQSYGQIKSVEDATFKSFMQFVVNENENDDEILRLKCVCICLDFPEWQQKIIVKKMIAQYFSDRMF